jgi:sulfur-oxidizing protein SoxX
MKERSSNPALVIVLALLLIISLVIHLVTFLPKEDSPRGFELPRGDADAGLVAFEALSCSRCHTLHGVALKETPTIPGFEKVALGGEVPRPIPYGELVTEIIHPDESIKPSSDGHFATPEGKSLMLNLNKQMTVQQLVDIVALLRDHYEVMAPEIAPEYMPYR